MSFRSKAEKYIKEQTILLNDNGISVNIDWENTTIQEDGLSVGGMFNAHDDSLSIAGAGPVRKWFPLFVHENQHAKQFIGRTKPWMDVCNIYKKQDALSIVFNWIDNHEYPDHIVHQSIIASRNIELDAERRTVKEFIKYGFDEYIDVEKYIRGANSYIYFYNMIYMNRKWYGDNFVNDKQINAMMPTHFNNNYDHVPLNYYRMCMKYCYK